METFGQQTTNKHSMQRLRNAALRPIEPLCKKMSWKTKARSVNNVDEKNSPKWIKCKQLKQLQSTMCFELQLSEQQKSDNSRANQQCRIVDKIGHQTPNNILCNV